MYEKINSLSVDPSYRRIYIPEYHRDESGFFGINALNSSTEIVAVINRFNFCHILERTNSGLTGGTRKERLNYNQDNVIEVYTHAFKRHKPSKRLCTFESTIDLACRYKTMNHDKLFGQKNMFSQPEKSFDYVQLLYRIDVNDILNADNQTVYIEELDLVFFIYRELEDYFPIHPHSVDAAYQEKIHKDYKEPIEDLSKLHVMIEAVSNAEHNEYSNARYICIDGDIHQIPVKKQSLVEDGIYVTINQRLYSTASTVKAFKRVPFVNNNEKITKRHYTFEAADKELHIKATSEEAKHDPFHANPILKLKHELDMQRLKQEQTTQAAKTQAELEKQRTEKLKQEAEKASILRKQEHEEIINKLKQQQEKDKLEWEKKINELKQNQYKAEAKAKRPKEGLEWLKAIAGAITVGISLFSLFKSFSK